jgi:hypothetical protein
MIGDETRVDILHLTTPDRIARIALLNYHNATTFQKRSEVL